MTQLKKYIIYIWGILLLSSCTNNKSEYPPALLPELEQAENVMYTHPDSALHILGKYYLPAMFFVDNKTNEEKSLPMIYPSGYLTIKDYNLRTDRYLLDFSNNEVRQGFLAIIFSGRINKYY